MQNGNFNYRVETFGDAGVLDAIGDANNTTQEAFFDDTLNKWYINYTDVDTNKTTKETASNIRFSHNSMSPRVVDLTNTAGWKVDDGPAKGIYECLNTDGYPYVVVYATDVDKSNNDGGSVKVTLSSAVVPEY